MRNVADHVISIIDRITDYAIILFALILLLNGTYGIYDNYMIYADATDESLKQIRDSYAKENGDTGEEFTFEIRLTDDLGRSLDSVNIISDRQE